MFTNTFLSILSLTTVLAAPRHAHQHHKRDVIVYKTMVVTQWHTVTAGDEQTAAAPVAVLPVSAVPVYVAKSSSTPVAAVAAIVTPVVAAAVSTPIKQATTLQTSAAAAVVSSTPATAASSSFKSTGSKRGLAWPSDNALALEAPFLTSSSPLSWYFNWGTGQTSGLSSLTFVYQQWSGDNLNNLNSIPSGSVVLGMNEPDHAGQAAMSAAAAAAIYKSTLTPLRKSGKISYLGSPATTNGGAGLPWLTEFMSLCSDCEIDFISQHWYGPTLTLLQSQLTAIHTQFGKPVWLTEFACTNWNAATNPSQSEVSAFMSSALAWMESTSWIEKYAWFGALIITDASLGSANQLVTSSGLTALGKQYMS